MVGSAGPTTSTRMDAYTPADRARAAPDGGQRAPGAESKRRCCATGPSTSPRGGPGPLWRARSWPAGWWPTPTWAGGHPPAAAAGLPGHRGRGRHRGRLSTRLGPAAYARPRQASPRRARQEGRVKPRRTPRSSSSPAPGGDHAVQRLRLLRRGHVAQQGVDPQLPAGDQAVAHAPVALARPGPVGVGREEPRLVADPPSAPGAAAPAGGGSRPSRGRSREHHRPQGAPQRVVCSSWALAEQWKTVSAQPPVSHLPPAPCTASCAEASTVCVAPSARASSRRAGSRSTATVG